jgi:hypothetical protein
MNGFKSAVAAIAATLAGVLGGAGTALVDYYVRERVRAVLARRHKVAGRGTRRFTYDEIHRNRGVLCLERLPRTAPLWALR